MKGDLRCRGVADSDVGEGFAGRWHHVVEKRPIPRLPRVQGLQYPNGIKLDDSFLSLSGAVSCFLPVICLQYFSTSVLMEAYMG